MLSLPSGFTDAHRRKNWRYDFVHNSRSLHEKPTPSSASGQGDRSALFRGLPGFFDRTLSRAVSLGTLPAWTVHLNEPHADEASCPAGGDCAGLSIFRRTFLFELHLRWGLADHRRLFGRVNPHGDRGPPANGVTSANADGLIPGSLATLVRPSRWCRRDDTRDALWRSGFPYRSTCCQIRWLQELRAGCRAPAKER